MTTLKKVIIQDLNTAKNNSYEFGEAFDNGCIYGLEMALKRIDEYAKQEKDAYDKVLAYLKANVDDFPDYHEAIEAVLKMKDGE